jgi:uncharacterized protein (TIGR02145 family)
MNRILLSFSCLLSVNAVIQAQSEFCGDGTLWDDASQTCVIDSTQFSCLTQPIDNSCYFDVSGNGVVGPEDLLSFLASFASTCEANLPPWACGDPLEYQGYDYETVQIGEQCWFAENLRTELYSNGDSILNFTEAQAQGLPLDSNGVIRFNSIDEYGQNYTWTAVSSPLGLCPDSWHVPTDEEWGMLELSLGMDSAEVIQSGWRGATEGVELKSIDGWVESGNGVNSHGFNGFPGGNGGSMNVGFYGYWWTATDQFARELGFNQDGILRGYHEAYQTFSVRCIKDTE